ncbi:hypothetical protein LX32DRAFT_647883 [Colletotrichum zoysiae]|uniref:YMC020W-like alpha/beta hydrolase domain-containing protein n=1 Tax=Colletotrichum zoysiae TaxID=1216348 RepID=A0AAD9HW44_9PEZI|nr:hypothetical protein LX32DRAFT_647883 [Colletotrichum zoysiae]
MSPRKRQRTTPSNPSSYSPPAAIAPAVATSATSQVTAVSETNSRPTREMPLMRDRSGSETTKNTTQNSQKQVPRLFWGRGVSQVQDANPHMQVRKSRSWYGSWPRVPKSSASTQLARETIFGGTLKPSSTPDFRRFDTKKSTDSASFDGPADSSTSLPQIPENGAVTPEDNTADTKKDSDTIAVEVTETQTFAPVEEQPKEAEPPKAPEVQAEVQAAPVTEPPAAQTHGAQPGPNPPASTNSWFGFWYSNPSEPEAPSKDDTAKAASIIEGVGTAEPTAKEPEDVVMDDAPPPPKPEPAKQPTAGSTWAFWSRETRPKTEGTKTTPVQPESGELAVIGQGSEAHPEHTGLKVDQNQSDGSAKDGKNAKESKDAKSKATKTGIVSAPSTLGRKSKRTRPLSVDTDAPSRPGTPNRPESVASSKASIMEATPKEPPIKPGTPKTSSSQEAPSKSMPANLLLPSFGSTYRMKENPSIPPANHVFKAKETPKINKAICVGVHGQPTGTSLRFANLGAEAIRRWADAHGSPDCEIEKVALEGDGKIADRVDNLWKLLLNWIEQIRNADLILVACHSQGVPVGVMLLAKLIDLGIITNAKLGVCAMAGVSLGPFPDYKSSMGILMGAANELWEFSNPDSDISKRYENSLKEVLQYGARITYIGSIDDQLVPMESAVYSPASHPYIYRAVFIDGRIHTPDFIAHLVGFALKLRNLGISDHGLLRELSTPLAGSLYSGEGHSRLYYDNQVYDLALAHALETSDVRPNPPATVTHRRDANSSLANPNPYHLPWIMRGLLEEDFVRTELSSETEELLQQFDDWKPVTKALKDVKYRLEAIRSKL